MTNLWQNSLLKTIEEAGKAGMAGSTMYEPIVEAIRLDHVRAARNAIRSPEVLTKAENDINGECQSLMNILQSTQHIGEVSIRASDIIIGKGEQLSCIFVTALLNDNGISARYVDLSSVIKSDEHGALNEEFYDYLPKAFASLALACGNDVPVITGFFGNVPGGLMNVIGRGYTDLCAALVAVGLHASELQIWKEVDGIFTADPRKVPTAHLLASVTPAEAAELTFYGSEVIHPFTMDQVIRAKIPIRIKNVMNPGGAGTIIFPEHEEETDSDGEFDLRSFENVAPPVRGPKRPTAITIKRNILILNVKGNNFVRDQGFLQNVFAVLNKWNILADTISTSQVQISMALHSIPAMLSGGDEDEFWPHSPELKGAILDLRRLGKVTLKKDRAIVSLVGTELQTMVGISGKFFTVLGDHNINVQMISQGKFKIIVYPFV
jgi:aspartate kinase